MPKISDKKLDAVIEAVAGFSKGADIEEIQSSLGGSVPRRTLQRRLALLVEQNRLTADGHARARRYRLPDVSVPVQGERDSPRAAAPGEIYPPIAPECEAIKQAVRAPIQHRHPVGYNRAFLDSYRPNATFYLPAEMRRRLAEMGRAPEKTYPAGTYARQIFNRLLIDLSWNSSRLEGNTYSLLETERLLELGENAEGKGALDAQMLLNHKAAIELLVEEAVEIGFNRYTILNLHALLADNLLADPQACGRLRAIPVEISGTVFHPFAVPQLIDECFRQILTIATEIADPFEQAFFVMVHLPYLQPFEDVNKRVSRLAANIPLIRRNLCPLSFVDVPARAYIDGTIAVYELNRVELLRDVFMWAYQRSCAHYSAVRQSLGDPDPFRLRYRAQIREFVARVVQERMDKKAAAGWIAGKAAARIPADDLARFIEVVETELSSLHEGNIARYRLRPADFQAWRESWH
jgi:Fic family protein